MNPTLFNILKSREDISDYLFHFTKGANAFETLDKIIAANALMDIGNKGVICFTEAPLVSLPDMFKVFERFYNPMYAPYGLAVRKDYLFAKGGRHVIYGPAEDRLQLPESMQWRFERYEPGHKDFSWLREWRLPETKLELDAENFFVITKHKNELDHFMFDKDDIIDIEFDGCVADGGFWGYATGTVARRFKGISIEDLLEIDRLSKQEMEKIINMQNFEDTGEVNLGGFIS